MLRKQRVAMVRSTDFIANLVKALDGGLAEGKTGSDTDMAACQQYWILDLLLWIIHQGAAEDRLIFMLQRTLST